MKIILFLLCTFFLQLSHATKINLINGDTINGVIIKHEQGLITISHAVLGTFTIEESQVKPTKPAAAVKEDSGVFASGYLTDWERSAEVGVNGSEGNSQNMDAHIGLSAKFENNVKRWNISSAYNTSSSDKRTSRSDFHAQFTRDFLLPDLPHFYFLRGRYDWDEFEDWDYRVDLSGGIGSQLIKTESWSLIGRTGLGFSKEFGGDNTGWVPEALLGLDNQWTIAEHQSVELNTTFYPSLEELGEFRNISEFNWNIGLADINNLNLKLGLVNNYDSMSSADSKKNDFKYRLLLVFGL